MESGRKSRREETTEGSTQERDEQAGQMEDGKDVIAVLDQAVMDEEGDDDDEEMEEMVVQDVFASKLNQ